MSYTRKDLEQMCRKLHLDLHDAQTKTRELMQAVASLPIPEDDGDTPNCPTCGRLKSVRTEQQLADHLENVHGQEAIA